MNLGSGATWTVHRAFGPVETDVPEMEVTTGQEALRWASLIGVTARIGRRIDSDLLAIEVGQAAAAAFRSASVVAALRMAVIEKVLADVLVPCVEHRVPVMALKGLALHLAGFAIPGSRACGDIDLLVPRSAGKLLEKVLLSRGFRSHGHLVDSHHPWILVHRHGIAVELHVWLPNVRIGGREADFEVLTGGGLCSSSGNAGKQLLLPSEEVLASHLLAHGTARRYSYPFGRLLADLADLRWSADRWSAYLAGEFSWVQESVDVELVESCIALIQGLENDRSIADLDGRESCALTQLVARAGYFPDAERVQMLHADRRGLRRALALIGEFLRRWFLPWHQYAIRTAARPSLTGYVRFLAVRPAYLIRRGRELLQKTDDPVARSGSRHRQRGADDGKRGGR